MDKNQSSTYRAGMGKVFDFFCDAIEKAQILKDVRIGDKLLKQVVRSVPLFDIPIATQASDIIPKEYTAEEIQFLTETFFLPFPCVVVEDKAGCVILEDLQVEQKGISQKRRFMTISHTSTMGSLLMPAIERLKLLERIRQHGHEMTIYMGEVELQVDDNSKFGGRIDLQTVLGVLQNGQGFEETKELEEHAQHAGRSLFAAYQEIALINTPHRFVVQEQPTDLAKRYREADKAKKLLRSADRPRYTLLTPTEIKAKFGLGSTGSDITSTNRAPHQRRRHYRTLRSEFFTPEKRGHVILIPACWVGDSEKEINGKKYKVMLDL